MESNTDNSAISEADKDSSKEQFAIASIILQLSQQPPPKRRKTKSIDGQTSLPNKDANDFVVRESNAVLVPSDRGRDESAKPKASAVDEKSRHPHKVECNSSPSQKNSGALDRESSTNELGRENGSWSMDDISSEGGGNYCASVSSGDDEKATKSELRRTYRCSKCGAEKKGHVCAAKIKEQKEVSASLAMQRGDLAARLAARMQSQTTFPVRAGSGTAVGRCSSDGSNFEGGMAQLRGCGGDDGENGIPSRVLETLPFFRSYRASEFVAVPTGVSLGFHGCFIPAL